MYKSSKSKQVSFPEGKKNTKERMEELWPEHCSAQTLLLEYMEI